MTDLERNIINDRIRGEFKRIDSSDIDELIQIAQNVEHTEGTNNALSVAIVKAFVLGYHRGKYDWEIKDFIRNGNIVYYIDKDLSAKKAEVIESTGVYKTLRRLDDEQDSSEKIEIRKSKIFPTRADAEECIGVLDE